MAAMATTIKDDFVLEGENFDASKLTLNRRLPSPWYVPARLMWVDLTPDYGKAGQPVQVEANMFQVRLDPKAAGTV